MSRIYYWHKIHSEETNKDDEFGSDECLPYGHARSERFADLIYHSRNSKSRFYVVVCGYEKQWNITPFTTKTDRYILHFILDGKGSFNNKPIQKGDLVISLPNQTYTIQHNPRDPMTYGWISLAGQALELMIEILHLPKKHCAPLSSEQLETIQKIFMDIIYTPHDKDTLSYYLFSQLFQLLTCAQISYSIPTPTNSPYIDHALRYINTHYAENISVSDVAKELGLSISHLRNLFAAEVGHSPQQMLINKRMSVATSLMLSDPDLPIQEIAEACGYTDQSSFSRRFKQQTGCAPSAYQKAIRLKKQNML